MDAFIFSANAVLPIILITFTGWLCNRLGFINDEFIKRGNKLNFKVGFFCLIFMNMYSIQSIEQNHKNLLFFCFVSLLCVITFGFIFGAIFVKSPKQKGVITQAIYRSNFAIIGVPLANMLYGDKGGACAAIIIAVSIPLFNIFAVIALTVFLKEGGNERFSKESVKDIFIKLSKNSMLHGIIAGAICLLIRPHLNGWTLKNSNLSFIYNTVNSISKMASPFALLMLGAGFKFSAVKKLWKLIFVGTSIRLIVVPTVCLCTAHFIFPEFSGPEYAGLIALFGSPVAVSSAIMADQMDNDGELAGQLLVWSTLFSTLTLFAFIAIFRARGIF